MDDRVAVVRELGNDSTPDPAVDLVLALIVVLERQLEPIDRAKVQPRPPDPLGSLLRKHGSERPADSDRVDDTGRLIVKDRTGEKIRSVPAMKGPAEGPIPHPLLQRRLLDHEGTLRAEPRVAEYERSVCVMMALGSVLRQDFDACPSWSPILGRVRILVHVQFVDGFRRKSKVAHLLAVHDDGY